MALCSLLPSMGKSLPVLILLVVIAFIFGCVGQPEGNINPANNSSLAVTNDSGVIATDSSSIVVVNTSIGTSYITSTTNITSGESNGVNNTTMPVSMYTNPFKPLPAASPAPKPLASGNKTQYSDSELRDHFMSVAFGTDNTIINRFDDPLIDVSISGEYTNQDSQSINNFSAEFNDLSSTSKLISSVEIDRIADIMIKFMPEASICSLRDERVLKTEWTPSSKTIAYEARREETGGIGIYLNSDMTGDVRTHYLIRSLLYGLGFYGESLEYPDSIFCSWNENITKMSVADKVAVEWMYGRRIGSGMTTDEVRAVL